jgi:hypothetical protein
LVPNCRADRRPLLFVKVWEIAGVVAAGDGVPLYFKRERRR